MKKKKRLRAAGPAGPADDPHLLSLGPHYLLDLSEEVRQHARATAAAAAAALRPPPRGSAPPMSPARRPRRSPPRHASLAGAGARTPRGGIVALHPARPSPRAQDALVRVTPRERRRGRGALALDGRGVLAEAPSRGGSGAPEGLHETPAGVLGRAGRVSLARSAGRVLRAAASPPGTPGTGPRWGPLPPSLLLSPPLLGRPQRCT